MNINLKNCFENDAPKGIKLPKYIRRARGFSHLTSICTQPKDETHECRGFDLGIAFFRDGTFVAILWRDYTLTEVQAMHKVNPYARFVLRGQIWHNGKSELAFARIVNVERAAKLDRL